MSEKRQSNKNLKTPLNVNLTTPTSSPRELRTPSKFNQPGIPRTVYTHGSTLQGLFNDWRRLRAHGTTLCRAILAMRLYECTDQEYPDKLGPHVERLVEAMDALENVVESISTVTKQYQALTQLQRTDEPVLGTWSAEEIYRCVTEIHEEYQRECKLKKYVTENIAHSRDESLSEALASAWELECHIDSTKERLLLTDLGITQSTT